MKFWGFSDVYLQMIQRLVFYWLVFFLFCFFIKSGHEQFTK